MAEEVQKEKPTLVDINDLNLVGEDVEVNPEGNAFVAPPPVPDGDHLAVIQPTKADRWEKRTSNGVAYFAYPNLEVRFTEPGGKYDDRPVFDWVSTMVMRGSGTCRIAGILRACGVAVPARTNHKDLAQLFHQTTQGKPSVKVGTQWRGYCKSCDKDVITGMARFPRGANGEPSNVTAKGDPVQCPNCGGELNIDAKVKKYASAGI
jgi:hypothetical protein